MGKKKTQHKTQAAAETTTTKKQEQAAAPTPEKSDDMKAILSQTIAQFEQVNAGNEEDNKRIERDLRKAQKEVKDIAASSAPDDEKLQKIMDKFQAQIDERRSIEREVYSLRRKDETLTKKNEQLSAALDSSNVLKTKLESLCRELQASNKATLEEAQKVQLEETNKRKEMSEKFSANLQSISKKMDEEAEKQIATQRENDEMNAKLKSFKEQYDIREQQFANEAKTFALERSLFEAKLKQQLEVAQSAIIKAETYARQVDILENDKKQQAATIESYGEKFGEFQGTLTKSNEVFQTFKTELDKNAKTIKSQQKEIFELKKKGQKSDVMLIQMVEEKKTFEEKIKAMKSQNEALQGLCRKLQAERSGEETASMNGAAA